MTYLNVFKYATSFNPRRALCIWCNYYSHLTDKENEVQSRTVTKCLGTPAGERQLRHQIPELLRACLGKQAHKAEPFQKLDKCAGGAGPRDREATSSPPEPWGLGPPQAPDLHPPVYPPPHPEITPTPKAETEHQACRRAFIFLFPC